MRKLLVVLGATGGGAVGWWLGDFVGLFTAVALSAVGTGVGAYFSQRWAAEHLP